MIKKLFLSVLLCTVCMFAMAQSQTVTHVVQRGETIESIAEIYKVSVEDINKANPNADGIVYVGMKLNIPQSKEPTIVSKPSQPIATNDKTQSTIDYETHTKKSEYVANDKSYKIKAVAGVTVGTWTGKDFKEGSADSDYGQASSKNKAIYQIHIGVVVDYLLSKNLYAGTGIFFNQNGYKQECIMTSGDYWDDEGANYDGKQTVKMTTNNIEVPIHLGGMYNTSNIGLFVEAGPYFSYAISGNKKRQGSITEYDDIHYSATDHIDKKEDIGKGSLENYQKFGYGLSATAGITINKFLFQFTYQRELSKAIKKTKQYEQNILLSIGYEF